MSVSDKKALFYECKWRREKVDYSVNECRQNLRGTMSEKFIVPFSQNLK